MGDIHSVWGWVAVGMCGVTGLFGIALAYSAARFRHWAEFSRWRSGSRSSAHPDPGVARPGVDEPRGKGSRKPACLLRGGDLLHPGIRLHLPGPVPQEARPLLRIADALPDGPGHQGDHDVRQELRKFGAFGQGPSERRQIAAPGKEAVRHRDHHGRLDRVSTSPGLPRRKAPRWL